MTRTIVLVNLPSLPLDERHGLLDVPVDERFHA